MEHRGNSALLESGGPAACGMIDTNDANLSFENPVDKDVWSSGDKALSGPRAATDAPRARELGDQPRGIVNSLLDERRVLLALFSDVCRKIVKVAHGGLAPDHSHALSFNFLALRIDW